MKERHRKGRMIPYSLFHCINGAIHIQGLSWILGIQIPAQLSHKSQEGIGLMEIRIVVANLEHRQLTTRKRGPYFVQFRRSDGFVGKRDLCANKMAVGEFHLCHASIIRQKISCGYLLRLVQRPVEWALPGP